MRSSGGEQELGTAGEEMGQIVASGTAENRSIDAVSMVEVASAALPDPGWAIAVCAPNLPEAPQRGIDAKSGESSVTTDRSRIGRRTDDAERHAEAVFVRPLEQGGADTVRLVRRRDEQVSEHPQVLPQRSLREADGGTTTSCDPEGGGVVVLQIGNPGRGGRG